MKQNGSTGGKWNLLVVDDNVSFLKDTCDVLSSEGMTVDGAAHGEEAIKLARQHSYDLVLLDINMPVMDGMQTLKILRKDSPASDVIMVTGYQDIQLAVESMKIGAKEYITKPIDPGDLVQRVKTALRAHAAEARVKNMEAQFSSRLLHELLNPLHSVHAAIDFMLKQSAGPVTDQQMEVLNNINTSITKMDALINDMIDLSLFESGNVELQKLPTNIDELIPAVCSRLNSQAKAKNVTISVHAADDIPTIELDTEKIEQVITNLIENSLKYTPNGGSINIKLVTGKMKINNANIECVSVSVTDTGCGISKEELPFVFDKYKEVLTGKESKQKTTGLGLAICKSIVEAHNGVIDVDSIPGKHTTFTFSLPVGMLS
jgi:signal transduction histidine kinase